MAKRFWQLSRHLLVCLLLLSACTPPALAVSTPASIDQATSIPDWFNVEFTDVSSGETFTIHDFAGKVVLVETMAIWCPTCILQASYMYKLHDLLGKPEDLVSISLDVDLHEDAATLKDYVAQYGFDWRFAVAPLEVDRALGNLYNANYINPPLAPMLLIDRDGNVHQLEFGLKDTETLRKAVEPYLMR